MTALGSRKPSSVAYIDNLPRTEEGNVHREPAFGSGQRSRNQFRKLRRGEGAPVGEMEYVLRHAIMGMIGGGTNEIQRNVIAQRGLELPR